MLRAEIIRDRQNAEKYIQAKQYGQAVKRLEAITQIITDSQFADQSEFKTILQEYLYWKPGNLSERQLQDPVPQALPIGNPFQPQQAQN